MICIEMIAWKIAEPIIGNRDELVSDIWAQISSQ
jgi:hypothetical protein